MAVTRHTRKCSEAVQLGSPQAQKAPFFTIPCNHPRLAVHFLSSMVHQDISPDVIVCNAVLSSCEKASYWTLALCPRML